ncbi:unnamed protein product [Amoebophrya sp. A120]|nr:unnamed protein product [Amoebophrya sp. A120]|eukprot:GSA120T00005746001.1
MLQDRSNRGLLNLQNHGYTSDQLQRVCKLCKKLMTPFPKPGLEEDAAAKERRETASQKLEDAMMQALKDMYNSEDEFNAWNDSGMTPLAAVLRGYFKDGGYHGILRRLKLFHEILDRGADVRFPFVADETAVELGPSVYGGSTHVYSVLEYTCIRGFWEFYEIICDCWPDYYHMMPPDAICKRVKEDKCAVRIIKKMNWHRRGLYILARHRIQQMRRGTARAGQRILFTQNLESGHTTAPLVGVHHEKGVAFREAFPRTKVVEIKPKRRPRLVIPGKLLTARQKAILQIIGKKEFIHLIRMTFSSKSYARRYKAWQKRRKQAVAAAAAAAAAGAAGAAPAASSSATAAGVVGKNATGAVVPEGIGNKEVDGAPPTNATSVLALPQKQSSHFLQLKKSPECKNAKASKSRSRPRGQQGVKKQNVKTLNYAALSLLSINSIRKQCQHLQTGAGGDEKKSEQQQLGRNDNVVAQGCSKEGKTEQKVEDKGKTSTEIDPTNLNKNSEDKTDPAVGEQDPAKQLQLATTKCPTRFDRRVLLDPWMACPWVDPLKHFFAEYALTLRKRKRKDEGPLSTEEFAEICCKFVINCEEPVFRNIVAFL